MYVENGQFHGSKSRIKASLSKDTKGVFSVWISYRIHFFLRNRLPKLPNSSRFLRVSYTVRGIQNYQIILISNTPRSSSLSLALFFTNPISLSLISSWALALSVSVTESSRGRRRWRYLELHQLITLLTSLSFNF